MKKFLAVLACAAMLTAGCGDAVENAADKAESAIDKKVDTVTKDVEQKVTNAMDKVGDTAVAAADSKFTLGGVSPGMEFSEVKLILGEPTSQHDDDEFTFADGLVVEIERGKNIVEEIKTSKQGVLTGVGISVGSTEQNLLDAYGSANSVERDDGKVEYKYYSGDNRMKIEFEVRNGVVAEIKSQLNN